MSKEEKPNSSHVLTTIEDTPELMISRKNDHITICQTKDVESIGENFSQYFFTPEALPEFHFNEVSTSQNFLGKTFSLPMLITGMTGGVAKGQEINEALALAAQKYNIPMGLGSQKMMLSDSKFQKLFDVRKVAPNLFLIGNLGAVSLNYGIKIEDIQRLIDKLQLNAFALHLNALQECIQPEGERNFSNLLNKIENIVKVISVPLIIKEVGSGIAPETFKKLVSAGVASVDVGGKGGTSWGYIEGLRSQQDGQRLGELFRNWGLRTDESLLACSRLKKDLGYNIPLVATGGIRNGLQVAKAVALGATMAGVGLPLFKAAISNENGCTPLESVEKELQFFQKALSITMFCSGARTLKELSSRIAGITSC
ncbi:type 2 isopentenyl-diphosphate Delta-isomerase [Pigmentibacter sp. JX0631]|uniref:type 2 isopentenyl-diphosphate Delta-isomerase n=1 Tax=Pigmentibacter sp. JX0631 TaxID=2976982 RepID=UPI0024691993|nr:type 2 isopentenyl-diphosphate Delta-isomerase [Pigmentibacter sp. JX0631]WGL59100.1 type 2 isopentenyl-diphosphate Delta-isomerase [Pigmentibacter sp. JX0631]